MVREAEGRGKRQAGNQLGIQKKKNKLLKLPNKISILMQLNSYFWVPISKLDRKRIIVNRKILLKRNCKFI